jgi:alkanesulfonate monooxygenase SsuD/methylene tetrahydromethanopterin reductase-like flavin-dependent oxidoreductase (luciferase family)
MDNPSFYAAIVKQVAWLDTLGLDLVWFTEHHFLDDGYLPSWIPVAGAMAARTKRLRFSTDICLMPFATTASATSSPGRCRRGCGRSR